MTLSSIRAQFPFTIDRIYMNHASISPLSLEVREKMDWYINNRSFGEIEFYDDINEITGQTKSMLAKLINAEKSNIAFTSNASEGMNHLLHSYSWKKGDQVIITNIESPANVYPFLNLASKDVELIFVKAKGGHVKVSDIEKALTPKTKMIVISFVEFISGYKNDLLEIGSICKKNNILCCVDGSHGVGSVAIDVKASHIDFLTCSGHKWLMGPMGTGFMYFSDKLFNQIKPAFVGYKSVKRNFDDLKYKLDLLPDARRFEFATQNYLGICGLWAALDQLLKPGISAIEHHLLILGKQLVERLPDYGLKFVGSDDAFYWSGIYSFLFDDAEELLMHLSANNIICSVVDGKIRFSPHYYNNREDVNEVIEVVANWYRSK
jgi:selenocysteine lyase/cysteine desulfurase